VPEGEVLVRAEMTANVWQVRVAAGEQVEADQELLVLESMKMEIPVWAPVAGVVTDVRVQPDQVVHEGDVLVVVTPA
jgi:acetyl-CoA carboxylase biotin carboxyl carrier protein